MNPLASNWVSPARLTKLGILGMNRRNVDYIGQYNARKYFPLVDDKLQTKLIAQKAGLMVPNLLTVVRTQRQIETITETLEQLDAFVIKPAQGSGGKGILVITSNRVEEDDGDHTYTKSSGDSVSIVYIKRHLSNVLAGLHSLGGRTDVAIIESLVRMNPLFSNLSHEGVPDIRLIVFKGFPVMGMLRLATTQSDGKANLHQGAVGVGLDIATGKSVSAVLSDTIVTRHPDTNTDLTGLALPEWDLLLSLAARCFDVTQLGYLGCDIVIDAARGPLLLELNARPGLSIQLANNAGLLPRLNRIENLDTLPMNVEERVAFSKRHFAHSFEGSGK